MTETKPTRRSVKAAEPEPTRRVEDLWELLSSAYVDLRLLVRCMLEVITVTDEPHSDRFIIYDGYRKLVFYDIRTRYSAYKKIDFAEFPFAEDFVLNLWAKVRRKYELPFELALASGVDLSSMTAEQLDKLNTAYSDGPPPRFILKPKTKAGHGKKANEADPTDPE